MLRGASLESYDLDRVAAITGVSGDLIRQAAILYATGGAGPMADAEYPASLIYQTVAHDELPGSGHDDYGDPAEIAAACINLSIITGNLGRPGGGVASPRGPANYQGVTDMGAHPDRLPGGFDARRRGTAPVRSRLDAALGRSRDHCNGFVPVRHLPTTTGLSLDALPEAIENGRVKAMLIGNVSPGSSRNSIPRWLHCRSSSFWSSLTSTPIHLWAAWPTSSYLWPCRWRKTGLHVV